MAGGLPEGTPLRGGEYVVESILGSGAFGITYRAQDTSLERYVAVKEFFPSGCQRDRLRVVPMGEWTQNLLKDYRQSFIREGRVLARLSHAGIVHIYSIFEQNDTAYLVMEYIEGQTLGNYLASQGGALHVDEAVRFIRQAGEALSVVHTKGLLHRDIKPANMMLRPDGQVMLIDFGAAREYTANSQRLTAILTPGYAPYEQYDDYGKYGPYTDVYALAAVLYQLLTGKVPINAISRRGGRAILSPRDLRPEIPEQISQGVMRGLELDAADRPATSREFVSLLEMTEPAAVLSVAAVSPPQHRFPLPPTVAPAPSVPALPLPFRSVGAAVSSGPSAAAPTERTVQCLQILKGHQGSVTSVAWSPHGGLLASGSRDSTVRLWDAVTGDPRAVMEGHAAKVNTVAWSGDSRNVLSGSWYSEALVWDAADAKQTRALTGHARSIEAVAGNPRDRRAATASADGTARIWQLDTEEPATVLKGHTDRVTSIAWSPEGTRVATGSDDRTVRLWDAQAGAQTTLLRGSMQAVASLAFSPDGKRLAASGYSGGTVWLWNLETEQIEQTLEVNSKQMILAVYSVAWRPGGRHIAFGCQDATVQIWDAVAGVPVHIMREHTRPVHTVAWSPDGARLATGSEDQSLRLWEIPEET